MFACSGALVNAGDEGQEEKTPSIKGSPQNLEWECLLRFALYLMFLALFCSVLIFTMSALLPLVHRVLWLEACTCQAWYSSQTWAARKKCRGWYMHEPDGVVV